MSLKQFLEKIRVLSKSQAGSLKKTTSQIKILKKGPAMRVIFFYPGEEGTYVDHAHVTLFENGIVHIQSHQEETTTDLKNCEILWRFEVEGEDRANKVRLLKPKAESRSSLEESEMNTPKPSSRVEKQPEEPVS